LVDQQICLGEPSLGSLVMYFAWALTLIALLQTIINFVWLGRINAANAAKVACAATEIEARFTASNARVAGGSQRWNFLASGQKEVVVTAALVTEHHMGSPWLTTAHKTLGIVGLVVFAAATIIQMIDMRDVAFYRGVLLVVGAHSVGASLGVFGAVPKYWPWIIVVFGLAGAVFALIAMIYDIGRQARCGAPVGPYELAICTTSGWEGYVVPVESSLVFLLTLLSTVFGVWSLATARRLRLKARAGAAASALAGGDDADK
jgi:hypothetical protein